MSVLDAQRHVYMDEFEAYTSHLNLKKTSMPDYPPRRFKVYFRTTGLVGLVVGVRAGAVGMGSIECDRDKVPWWGAGKDRRQYRECAGVAFVNIGEFERPAALTRITEVRSLFGAV